MSGAPFVLVHGAWHGGWCWRAVSDALRDRGHDVFAPTLAGLAERSGEDGVDLARHVDEVASLIEREDLRGVHLVGWSYGGLVISGALARVADRIAVASYLDAFLPEDGEALADLIDPELRVGLQELGRHGLAVAAPDPQEAWGLDDPEILAHARERLTPQPIATLTQPVRAPRTWPDALRGRYLRAHGGSESPHFDCALERARAHPAFETDECEFGHALLLSHPDRVVAWLVGAER